MKIIIYILATISIVLSISGLSYEGPKKNAVRLSSIISIIFSSIAIVKVSIIPLIIGFAINWIFRLLGMDPGFPSKKSFKK